MMDWHLLYSGRVTMEEVHQYVKDGEWQKLRRSLVGTSLKHKYITLQRWLELKQNSRAAQVQVTNYVTALSRGGLIRPEDYR